MIKSFGRPFYFEMFLARTMNFVNVFVYENNFINVIPLLLCLLGFAVNISRNETSNNVL